MTRRSEARISNLEEAVSLARRHDEKKDTLMLKTSGHLRDVGLRIQSRWSDNLESFREDLLRCADG